MTDSETTAQIVTLMDLRILVERYVPCSKSREGRINRTQRQSLQYGPTMIKYVADRSILLLKSEMWW